MTPRPFITIALTVFLALPLHAARKPNILVIVADDLGYGETTVQGYSKQIPTPHIDSIAENGIRFTNGYVSGPYCSPTRAGLMTGRYQERFGHEFNPGPQPAGSPPPGLSLNERTIGNRMKDLGYATGWFGKSHLGFDRRFHPLNRGFDEFFGFLGGAHSYFDPGFGRFSVFDGYKPARNPGYLTQAFADKTSKFIERNAQQPWFAYLAFNAVHAPLDTLQRHERRFSSIEDPKRRKFAALLTALDESIGDVLSTIRRLGLENDTLIFFISDNGGPTRSTTSGNGPLKGYKGQTSEGGIRVPFFVQWKGTLPKGVIDHRPVIQLDILPTSIAAAGGGIDPTWNLDGVDLLPYLRRQAVDNPHDALYWRFGEQLAIRKGNWKLVKSSWDGVRFGAGIATTDGAKLYNLAKDAGEKRDLSREEPEKFNELAGLWNNWNLSLAAAAWPPAKRNGVSNHLSFPIVPEVEPQELEVAVAAFNVRPFGCDLPQGTSTPEIAPHSISIRSGIPHPILEAEVIADDDSEGVIAAIGGIQNGLALHVPGGRLTFSIRRNGMLTSIASGELLKAGRHRIEAQVDDEGVVGLAVDGKIVASKPTPLPVPTTHDETISIGFDRGSPVGDYTSPHPFSGKVTGASVFPINAW